MPEGKSVALHTLGCKLNYSETSSIERLLERDGFVKKDFTDEADVYVINTCSVTDNADKECRQLVRRIQRRAPEAMVVITGCYAQLKPKEIAEIQGVDLVLGAAEKFNITHHLQQLTKGDTAKICSCDIEDVSGFNSSFSINNRTRTFLKVQDGCDYNCSFCTIPMARGKSRSNTIENVLNEVNKIASEGVKEIVLTGINLGDFGRNGKGEKTSEDFYRLLQALEINDALQRYRISSIEPNLLSDEIIRFVAQSKKIMPHFHIPLQSGSNKILGLMRRRYRKELYADKIALIKNLIPACCIGVDVITGFPGETHDDFKETLEFLKSIDASYFHVFTYSERANTHASNMEPAVPVSIRNERTKILRSLSYKKLLEFSKQHENEIREVLFEGRNKNGMMDGYTDNYIKITVPYKAEWSNEIIKWKI
ncbi:MAG: tRNA (N(6)-L-threonylcarbamoyladenosine(37)-C(2))-methylthiotransferase MtaB [Bacteroidota bacterium]|nr:tRNA (N(6)-L-threonylcarbamoyladenosine(37)-C(2))-methylthiotransferase MtaB [Bacteroidota bacterium]